MVVPMNEPLIGYHLSPFLANDLGYQPEDLDLDTFTLRRSMGDDPDRFFAESLSDVWLPSLRRLLNERFEAHLSRSADGPTSEKILLVKEPNGSQSADILLRAQPSARLLFLLRDGRDVVDSALASNVVGGWGPRLVPHLRGIDEGGRLDFVRRFAYQWLWQTEVVQAAFAAHRGPKHMVRYEDLLRDTPARLEELFEWLGLPLEEAEIAALAGRFAFERIPSPGPERFHRSATPGAWRENLRPEERAAVEEVLGAKLRELDYAEEPEAGTDTTRGGGRSTGPARGQAPARGPQQAKLDAIDFAVERLDMKSFASLEIARAFGQYAFYTMEKPTVQRGVLVDVRAGRTRDHLLSAIEQAAERPGLSVLEGSFSDPRTVAQIGEVDAVLLDEVLCRVVDPDWDRVLELYAPTTSCFVIANPQWQHGEATVRLIDLGRERFLEMVPPTKQHRELFDRLDEWHAAEQRPHRDGRGVWQWGITDADLKARMSKLGFSPEHEWRYELPRGAAGFVGKTFVFSRRQTPGERARRISASIRQRLAPRSRSRREA
jgi:hypothetical protein